MQTTRLIMRHFKLDDANECFRNWGQDKSLGKYITVDIPYPQLKIGEIGYVIGEKYQNQGFAYEAVYCVLEEYLINKNLFLIEAKVNETNISSMKLLEKLGFQMEARLRGRRMDVQTEERNDLLVYSISEKEM